jgi:Tfp pilus assembly protein PilF
MPNDSPPDPTIAALARAEEAAKARRLHEAIGICRDVLDQHPNHPAALALLGSVLAHRNETIEATRLLEQACALRPNVASWHNNLSSLYRMDCQLDRAVEHGHIAVQAAPNAPLMRLSLAKAQMDRGDHADAIASFLEVLSREPANPEAHLAIGQILLAHRETEPGWREYEWRNRLDAAKGTLPDMARPEWNGMALPTGTIMLIGDQGFGDTIMFARYIPLVAARCARVILACGVELHSLLANIPGVHASFTRWQDAPPYTVWCRLSSLGGIFATTPDTIPGPPPYLHADPARSAAVAAAFNARFPVRKPRIGLFWSGRPTHPNDRRRSLRLAQLAPITELKKFDFISLQKQVPEADAARLAAAPNILDLAADLPAFALTDFAATAAIIANLDLLISVDSAVVHLAGALGKPVIMLTGTPADWRWMLDRADSPWYPSLSIVRQPTPGDWTSVISGVAKQLRDTHRG